MQTPSATKKPRKTRKDKGIKRGPRKPKVVTLEKAIETLPVNTPVLVTKIDPQPHLTVEDKYPRSVLSEGRSYGVSFAFAKLEGGVFKCVGPLSPCKDYLNDQVYTEATGKPYSAYGYSAKHEGLFKDGFAHVVMRILGYKSGTYSDQDRDTKALADNYHAIAAFINWFEAELKLPTRTIIQKVGDYYVASIPPFWAQYTYLISLWTCLVRIAIEAGLKSVPDDPMDWMEDAKCTDTGKVSKIKQCLKAMFAGKIPVQYFTTGRFWHNEGIITFQFPQ